MRMFIGGLIVAMLSVFWFLMGGLSGIAIERGLNRPVTTSPPRGPAKYTSYRQGDARW